MCKVSVVIPVYNVERYLPDCLNSVLNQTLRDLEVICIDDHSPDGCGRILDDYAEKDPRVKVIHLSENHRQGYGRNRGLEAAKGEYVYFLDSDDLIEQDAMEALAKAADQEALDTIFFDNQNLFESEELKKVYMPPKPRTGTYRKEIYEGKDLLDDFIQQGEWTCYPQRTFWRREFLMKEGIRFPENCEHEDEFFAFAGILAAKRAKYIPKEYFILRIRPNSVMTSEPGPKNFHGYLMNYYYMNQFIAKRGINTHGAEMNITHMHERMNTLYEGLKDHYDLREICFRDPDRTVYQCFVSYIRAEADDNWYNSIDEEVLEKILPYRLVYIYGIKLTGQRFLKKAQRRRDIRIGGFLALEEDRAGEPPILLGHSIEDIQTADIPKDAIVVVATKVMFWDKIRGILESRNIPCVFHRRL